MTAERGSRNPLWPIFLTVFIDLLGVTLVLPILAPLFLDLTHGIMPYESIVSDPGSTEVQSVLRTRTILFGLLIATFPLAQFFGAPLLGAWADRVGRKKVLLLSLLGTLTGYVLFALGIHMKWVWLLFAGRLLDGFTGGNISIAFSAISDISPPEQKTRNFGLIGMAFGLGFIIGPYLGGKLSDPNLVSWFTFETPFWFAAFLCLINLIGVYVYFQETLRKSNGKKVKFGQGFQHISRIWHDKSLRLIFWVVFLVTFGFSTFTQFLQVFLIQKFDFKQSAIGNYFAYIGLWIAFTQGFLTRRCSKFLKPVDAVKLFLFTLSLAIVSLLIPDKAIYLYMLSPFIAISQGLLSPNLQTLVSNSADGSEQGEIMGMNQSVQSLAQAIPPIIAGITVSIHRSIPIITASLFVLLAGVNFYLYYYPRNKS